MTEEKKLSEEELENVTGGTTYNEDTVPNGAIIFTIMPLNMGLSDYVCSNIQFNGLTNGKNNGYTCAHCNRLDWYITSDGLAHGCCTKSYNDFRKVD